MGQTTQLPKSRFQNIIIDHHHYEVFTESQVALNVSTHLENIKNYASAIGKEKAKAIVGEWSAALTDCPLVEWNWIGFKI